jgi:hypothetical protein
MKLKLALLAAFLTAGLASSFALADGGTPGATTSTATSTTTSTTAKGKGDDKKPDKPKCQKVELRGTDAAGSVSFTVAKASKKGADMKGKAATLTFAAAKAEATACLDAAGNLTLRHLELSAKG